MVEAEAVAVAMGEILTVVGAGMVGVGVMAGEATMVAVGGQAPTSQPQPLIGLVYVVGVSCFLLLIPLLEYGENTIEWV